MSENLKVNLTQKEKEIIFGSLLGDGYLNCRYDLDKLHGSPRFVEEHGNKQYEYILHKSNELKNLLTKEGISTRNRIDARFKVKEYKIHTLRTKNNSSFIEFHEMFYIGKKKIIPKDLSLLTPLAIAYWFMDDGSKTNNGYRICTNCFEIEDLKRIQFYLLDMYNIETNIDTKKQIYIRAKSRFEFTELIKNFVIKTMEYKLHI